MSSRSLRNKPASPSGWRRLLLAVLLNVCCGGGIQVQAAPDEAAVQAAFILNFAKFTEWPVAQQPMRLGGMRLCQYGGGDDLAQALHALDGRLLQGVPIQWRTVSRLEDVRQCHVLYVRDSTVSVATISNWPVLTVSDQANFAEQGGGIALLRHGGRMRFVINRGATQAAGLKLSADLLALAVNVLESPTRREGAP